MKVNIYFATDEVSDKSLVEMVQYHVDNSETLDELLNKSVELWECLKPTHKNFLSAGDIIYAAHEQAYCDSEYAEDYLTDVLYNKEALKEFDAFIESFLDKYSSEPSWYQGNILIETIPLTLKLLDELEIDYSELLK